MLRTGKCYLAVDDEERHAVNMMPTRQFTCFLQRFHSLIALQHGLGISSIQTSLGNHVNECLPIADVPALREVGPEQ